MSTIQTTNLKHESSGSNNIVLDSSGNIAVQAGTVSAPAIQATGDSNTGIYFPAADNIGFTTGGTIRGRWTTNGLCFNADTAAANALDDYEEGTWTPTVAGSTTAGTATYSTQTGFYTKVGRLVTVSVYVEWSSGTGTGNLQINGLPFPPVGFAALAISNFDSISMPAGYYGGAMMHTNSGIFIRQNVVGGGPTANVSYDGQGGLVMSGTYSATA